MIHPVGELPVSVYWRRRALIAFAAMLTVVTVFTLFGGGGGGKKASGTPAAVTSSAAPSPTPSSATTSPVQQPDPSTAAVVTTTQPTTVVSGSPATGATTAVPQPCLPANLKIGSSTDAASYKVGAQPMLSLVVINTGPAPCVQDLADGQIELRVYSGSARVWGSHDCAVQPGRSLQTLPVGAPIKREIQWSGLSSQVGCAGVRTRVSAGTYALLPLLSGQVGVPTQFRFTG